MRLGGRRVRPGLLLWLRNSPLLGRGICGVLLVVVEDHRPVFIYIAASRCYWRTRERAFLKEHEAVSSSLAPFTTLLLFIAAQGGLIMVLRTSESSIASCLAYISSSYSIELSCLSRWKHLRAQWYYYRLIV